MLGCNEGQPVPGAALESMFPAGRQLPLVITPAIDSWAASNDFCLDTAALAHIITACPSLKRLFIWDAFEPGTDLSPLLQLPKSCLYLRIGKEEAKKPAAAAILAQLTQLKDL